MAKGRKGHILVVDDDLLTVKTLSMILASHNYEVTTAGSGVEAIEILKKEGFASFVCVLTDYRMPRVTGLDLMLWIHERDSSLSAIILTGEGEKRLVENALRGGASDYLEKPFSIQQIIKAIENAIEETRRGRNLASTASDVRALEEVKQKLSQQGSKQIRHTKGASLQISSMVYPIKETGGDFLNVWPLDDDRLFVLAGDVSGHDLRAGYISAYFQGIARGMLEMGADMAAIGEFFNRYLTKEWNHSDDPNQINIRTSLCACMIQIDTGKRELQLLNIGLPRPTLTTNCNHQRIGITSPPLGWHDELVAEASTHTISSRGYCYLWTDGLEEMAMRIQVSPHALAHTLFQKEDEEERINLIRERSDDILLMRLNWSPPHTQCPPCCQIIFQEEYPGNRKQEIDEMQEVWFNSLQMTCPKIGRERINQIILCCREAMLNAFEHGCKNRRAICCHLEITLDFPSEIAYVTVRDEGEGYDTSRKWIGHTDDQGHVSYGLMLIRGHAQDVTLSPDGTTIEMSFPMKPLTVHSAN